MCGCTVVIHTSLLSCMSLFAQNYMYASAQVQVSVSCVCVFKDNRDSFPSDQSVLVFLCSLKMFVPLAKHKPINSA